MYGINSKQPLPEEIITSYQAWEHYMAHLWYLLLHYCEVPQDGIIVEIGPGCSTKIAEALGKTFFRGTFYIIEPNRKLATLIAQRCEKILPGSHIEVISLPLHSAFSKLPKQPHCLVANHVFDDMLLTQSVHDKDLFDVSNWALDPLHSIGDTKKIWKAMSQDARGLESAISRLAMIWQETIDSLCPKFTLLSQYNSYTLATHGLDDLNIAAKLPFKQLVHHYASLTLCSDTIQSLLNSCKHYQNAQIGQEVLNAENWCVIEGQRSSSALH